MNQKNHLESRTKRLRTPGSLAVLAGAGGGSKSLDREDRKTIGEDIKLVQFRWPLGMPLVRKMESDLWEVRSNLNGGRIARVFFTSRGNEMALLHGFIKKSQKTPQRDLNVAHNRKNLWRSGRRFERGPVEVLVRLSFAVKNCA